MGEKHSSIVSLLSALQVSMNRELRDQLYNAVEAATRDAAEKVKADMMTRLNEMISVEAFKRADGAIEVSIIFKGWE